MLNDMTDEPRLRVLRGNPTGEELAALAGALLLRPAEPAAPAPAVPVSHWARSARPGVRPAWR
jgi:hypothetical protein